MYNWFSHYNDTHIYDLSYTPLKYCTKPLSTWKYEYYIITRNIQHILRIQKVCFC